MAFVKSSDELYDRIMEGWERQDSPKGIPYYMNHQYERTQWDHPIYEKIFEDLGDFDRIKYAAYRTSLKLIYLQKKLQLDLFDLHTITVVFDKHGYTARSIDEAPMTCGELENLLIDLCRKIKKDRLLQFDVSLNAELILNWILNLYDVHRTGAIRSLSVMIALATLSAGRLIEKYKYFFRQASSNENVIDRKRFGIFLRDLMQLVDLLNESSPFGGMSVGAAVDNCFQRVANGIGIHEEAFLDWMFEEPQTIVWLPTLHRITSAETVKHDVKCKLCKVNPITGLRYRCLKCFNFDMCQTCFYTGRVNSKHKVTHPTQEYCVSTTSRENTKAVLKTIRNNISKKYKKKINKPSYLPINQNTGTTAPADVSYDWDDFAPDGGGAGSNSDCGSSLAAGANGMDFDEYFGSIEKYAEKENIPHIDLQLQQQIQQTSFTPPPQLSSKPMPVGQRNELESIIGHLEDENRDLLDEIERLHDISYEEPSTVDSRVENERVKVLQKQKDHLEAKQEILESYNQRLEKQVSRLKTLLHQNEESRKGNAVTYNSGAGAAAAAGSTLNNVDLTITRPPLSSPQRILVDPPPYQSQSARFKPPFVRNLDGMMAISTPKVNVIPTTNIPLSDLRTPMFASPVEIDDYREDRFYEFDTFGTSAPSDLMSRTRFNIPSMVQSCCNPEEEAELQYLMEQLQTDIPQNISQTAAEDAPRASNMYELTNQIGGAMSEFVGAIHK